MDLSRFIKRKKKIKNKIKYNGTTTTNNTDRSPPSATLLQKQRAIKNPRERPRERGAAAAAPLGSGRGWRRTPARRARLIGRETQRHGGGGSAISLRGLERVHARGQRCRAGRRSTGAPRPGPAEPRPRRAAAPGPQSAAALSDGSARRRRGPCWPQAGGG